MKEFHSELAANPAHYSYGYSVYGTLEDTDNLSTLFEQGFFPFVAASDVPPMMYMTRGTRVRIAEFKERTYHTRVRRKAASHGGEIDVHDFLWNDFLEKDVALSHIFDYFERRHGKGSMPRERLRLILEFPRDVHLVEYRIGGGVAGYSIEIHTREASYLWYFAYMKEYDNAHIGARIVLDCITRAKEAGRDYVYLGASHGPRIKYKTNFQPLEYWNGRSWIEDINNRFSRLIAADSLRVVVTTDEWRDTIKDFYPAPHAFGSFFLELRFLYLVLTATPRVMLVFVGWLLLLFVSIAGVAGLLP